MKSASATPASEPAASALRLEQVSKSYGSLKALDGISVQVQRGEFVALLGPNGAGKSTLFQLLSGLFVADQGAIQVLGLDIRKDSTAALAGLGIVFQQPALDLDLSAKANLVFHARLHGMRGPLRQRRIQEELQKLGLEQQADKLCRTLSGGNRRKVELARALVHSPALLLMDEATVGLDPASRSALLGYVHELRTTRNVGVLWATHLVDEAEQADRVVVLHHGKILWDGPPHALVANSGQPSLGQAFLVMTGATGNEEASG